MRSIHCLIVAALCTAQLSAGELFDALVEFKTDFRISVRDLNVEVLEQGITLRAVDDLVEVRQSDGVKTKIGVGYRAYHLEFAYTGRRIELDKFDRVEFYSGEERIFTLSVRDGSRQITANEQAGFEVNFIAINLEDVPLLMLDQCDRINFAASPKR